MVNIVLVEPEIPQNTGNIARTCAVTGSRLHLVEPLGFSLEESKLKRAGLDYWRLLDVTVYSDLEDFFTRAHPEDFWLATTRGKKAHTEATLPDGTFILLGKETAGLPQWLVDRYPDRCLRIPQIHHAYARCLNLSNAAAVLCYEALRQQGFPEMG